RESAAGLAKASALSSGSLDQRPPALCTLPRAIALGNGAPECDNHPSAIRMNPHPSVRTSATKKRPPEAGVKGWEDPFLDEGDLDVSVCIANWNCRDHLRKCLESLHFQPQGVRFETIVVDNGSDDGAADMVEREFPEVTLRRNARNEGFARANNQAARLAD